MRPRRDVCSSRDVKVQVLLIAITGLDVIFHVRCFSMLIRDETETRLWYVLRLSRDCLETETSRPRPQPWIMLYILCW